MTPLDLVLSRIPGHRRQGHSYRAPCPGHGGDNPEGLKITAAEDGAVLLYCYTRGCTADDVVRAVGLELQDLFPEGHPGRRGQRPKPGWSWKRQPKKGSVKELMTVETEKLAVEFASLTLLKLLYPLDGKPPQAEDAASEAIAPYNALIEDLWAVYSQRQRHDDVHAAWAKRLPALQMAAPEG